MNNSQNLTKDQKDALNSIADMINTLNRGVGDAISQEGPEGVKPFAILISSKNGNTLTLAQSNCSPQNKLAAALITLDNINDEFGGKLPDTLRSSIINSCREMALFLYFWDSISDKNGEE